MKTGGQRCALVVDNERDLTPFSTDVPCTSCRPRVTCANLWTARAGSSPP